MARLRGGAIIEPLGADLVALAQAHALDVTTFPHPSLPLVAGGMDVAPLVWIARLEHGGPVVGFVATRVKDLVLDISGLAVDVAHHRRGLGRGLVRAAIRSARARGLSRIVLHVSTGNAAAIALYESEGFRREQRQPHYYTHAHFPDDGAAWLMVRSTTR